MSVSLCMSVSVCLSGSTHPIFTKYGSVLLWRRFDKLGLYTSGFMEYGWRRVTVHIDEVKWNEMHTMARNKRRQKVTREKTARIYTAVYIQTDQPEAASNLERSLTSANPPHRSLPFFYRTDYMDSPDCLLLLLRLHSTRIHRVVHCMWSWVQWRAERYDGTSTRTGPLQLKKNKNKTER